jgi:uncharacterized membrane protein
MPKGIEHVRLAAEQIKARKNTRIVEAAKPRQKHQSVMARIYDTQNSNAMKMRYLIIRACKLCHHAEPMNLTYDTDYPLLSRVNIHYDAQGMGSYCVLKHMDLNEGERSDH